MIITCDTQIESLLDVEKVEEYTKKYTGIVNERSQELYNTIETEQQRGLSVEAFYIDNEPILNEKSETVKKNINNIEKDLSNWKNTILSKAYEKRQEEIKILKRKIEEKIQQLQDQIISSHIPHPTPVPDSVNNIEKNDQIHQEINYYRNKYEQVMNLK